MYELNITQSKDGKWYVRRRDEEGGTTIKKVFDEEGEAIAYLKELQEEKALVEAKLLQLA